MSESLAITIFVLVVTGVLFLLPFLKETFHQNKITNLILKRCCLAIAIYLMMLNSAMMQTIAVKGGLDLTNELFRYTWLFGWGGYIFLFVLGWTTFFSVLKLWKYERENTRMGGNKDE